MILLLGSMTNFNSAGVLQTNIAYMYHFLFYFYRFVVELTQHLHLVSLCSLGIALLQVVGVIITTCLFSNMKEGEKKEEKVVMKDGYWRAIK